MPKVHPQDAPNDDCKVHPPQSFKEKCMALPLMTKIVIAAVCVLVFIGVLVGIIVGSTSSSGGGGGGSSNGGSQSGSSDSSAFGSGSSITGHSASDDSPAGSMTTAVSSAPRTAPRWLNDFAACPTATCGLRSFTQTRTPLCYRFDSGTPTIDASACSTPEPASSKECAAAPQCTSFCTISGSTGVRPEGAVEGGIAGGDPLKPGLNSAGENLAACQTACRDSAECVAFDFIFGAECYLKTSFPSGGYSTSSSDMQFYWSNKASAAGGTIPAECTVPTSGGGALPCSGAIENCRQLDAAQLLAGYCSCAACEPVAHCASQASGHSCMCSTCVAGYVKDADGQCQPASATAIVQTVSWHTLGGFFAMQHGWSMHLSGQTRGRVFHPRAMHSATCTPAGQNEERLFITWDEHMGWTKGRYEGPVFIADSSGGYYQQSSRGRVTELNIKADGTTTLVSDSEIELCMEMGEVTASADCSVVGLLCRSKKLPSQVAGAVDVVAQNPTGFGWTNEWCHKEQVGDDKESGGKGGGQCPTYDTRDDSMYLLEYTGTSGGGSCTRGGPSSTVCVNKAVGGWMIGNWAISLDKLSATYVLDLKVTAGGHEGSVNLAVDRAGWKHNAGLSAGWACGVGHTEANQLTYNPELGLWARLCWTDGNSDGVADMWASYFQTLPAAGGSGTKQILKLPGGNQETNPNPLYEGPGGAAFYVSLGAAGWVGVGYRPVPADESKPRLQQQLALSLINLKPTSDECRPSGGAEHDGSACGFTDLVDLPGRSLWNYDGNNGALGFVNLARIGTGGTDLLAGYATRIKHLNEDYPPLEYRVAKLTSSGSVLATKKLSGTGWGEENAWLPLANGCVAFPYVWNEFPGAAYGNNGADGAAGSSGFSNKLRVSVVCDL